MNMLKNLKYLILLSLLIPLSNCSDDYIHHENEALSIPGVEQDNPFTTSCDNEKEIIVTYNFDPFTPIEEQISIKENFETEMSQYFTICRTIESKNPGCANKDKWIVDGKEYDLYMEDPDQTRTNDNDDDGDGELLEVPEGGYFDDCFN